MSRPKYYGTGSYWGKQNGIWTSQATSREKCVYCGYGMIGKSGFCLECGTCEDCGAYRTDCACYSGYYNNFDWNQSVIGRKAIEASTASCGVRSTADADRAAMVWDTCQTTPDDAHAGAQAAEDMQLG